MNNIQMPPTMPVTDTGERPERIDDETLRMLLSSLAGTKRLLYSLYSQTQNAHFKQEFDAACLRWRELDAELHRREQRGKR